MSLTLVITSSLGTVRRAVDNVGSAQVLTRAYIEARDLTAGCGADQSRVFDRALVLDDHGPVASISYNGRAWPIERGA